MNPDDIIKGIVEESSDYSTPIEDQVQQPQTQTTDNQTATRDQLSESLSDIELPDQVFESAAVGLRDFVDNTFQGDQRSKEEITTDRENIKKQSLKKQQERDKQVDEATLDTAPLTTIAREAVRAPLGGITGAVEGLVNTADLIGDTALTLFTDEDEKNNVLGDKYEELNFNLGIKENKTAVGSFVREAISIYVLMRRASVVPGLGGAEKTSAIGRIGVEGARGAIADFITDGGSGNLSNLLEEINPNLKDTFWTALAHDEDDNPWERKLKNTIEGGFFGLGVDGVSELLGATRAARRVLNKKGYKLLFSDDPFDNIKKADMDDAIDAALQHIRDNSTWYPTKDARLIAEYKRLNDWPVGRSQELLDNFLGDPTGIKTKAGEVASEVKQKTAAGIEEGFGLDVEEAAQLFSPALRRLDKSVDIRKQISVQAQIDEFGDAWKSTYTPNGAQIDWHFNKHTTGLSPGVNNNQTISVAWDISKEKTNLRNLRKTFNFVVNTVRYDFKFQKALEKLDTPDFGEGGITRKVWQELTMQERVDLIDDTIDYGKDINPEFRGPYKEVEKILREYDSAIGNNLGKHGTKVFSQFNELIRDLPTGTVLENSPISDSMASKISDAQQRKPSDSNTRGKVYQRAGFGPIQSATDTQYAVVKRDATGKNVLRPVEHAYNKDDLRNLIERIVLKEQHPLDPEIYKIIPGDAAGYLRAVQDGKRSVNDFQGLLKFINDLTPQQRIEWLKATTSKEQNILQPYLPVETQKEFFDDIRFVSEIGDTRVKWKLSPDLVDVDGEEFSHAAFLNLESGNVDAQGFGIPRIPIYDINWDVNKGAKLGTSAKRVITKFNELVAEHLPPGTILAAEPIPDRSPFRAQPPSDAQVRQSFQKQNFESLSPEQQRLTWLSAAEEGAFGEVDEFPTKWSIGDEVVEVNSWDDIWNKMSESERLNSLKYNESYISKLNEKEGVRSRIYEAAGFSELIDGRNQYAMVNGVTDSRGRAFEPLDIDNIDDQFKRNTTPPEQLYEPHERAGRTKDGNPQEAAKSQAQIEDFDNISQVASTPLLSDAAYSSITTRSLQGSTRAEIDELKDIIAEVGSQIDVEELSRSLGQSDLETVSKALVSIRKFLGATDETSEVAMNQFKEGSSFLDESGNTILSRQGVVGAKVLITDTALQIQNLAEVSDDLILHRLDTARQSEQLVDRLGALLRLHKVSAIHYGGGLRAFQLGIWNLTDIKGGLSQKLAILDNSLNKMKELLRKGDADAISEYKELVRGLVLSNGDPTKQISFWQLFATVGGREALKTMYNSMLSGPVTQARNIIGSAMTSTLRPLAMATGFGLQGNKEMARISMGAFHSYQESLGEAFTIFKKSWNENRPINEGEKFAARTAETKKILDVVEKSAVTDNQKAAANLLRTTHNFLDSPWLTYPTRAMTATDDAFKTLVSRMELKREAMEQTFKQTDKGFEVDEDIYAKLLDQKIGVNGEIINQKLLATAKEITFQQDLEGWMGTVAGLLDESPVFKYFVPFVKTPHNIMVYSGTYIPGVNRLLKEVRDIRNAPIPDPKELAILEGRLAIGKMAAITGFMYAASGNMTGNGPADYQQYQIWRKYNQPQSIRIGNRWVSYASIEPLNVIFAAAADIPIVAKRGYNEGAQALLTQLGYTIANATTKRSYFEGLSSALAFLNPTELTRGENLEKEIWKLGNTMFPLSSARRQLSKALRPGLLEYNNQFEKTLHQAIPGYSLFRGTPKIDIFTGEQVENQSAPWSMDGLDIAGGVANQFLPFNISRKSNDPVIKKLNELGIDVTTVEGYSNKDLSGIELTAPDRAELNKYMAEFGLHKNLEKLFANRRFIESKKKWDKAQKQFKGGPAKESEWYKMVIAEFSKADSYAKREFKKNSDNGFNKKLIERNAQKRQRAAGIYQ